jgi:predicted metalloprotease with PDZ domain
MKKLFVLITLFYFAGCSTSTITNSTSSTQIVYNVDVTDYKDDLFHITVLTDGLTKENNIYNLPATVPGTYSNLNFGRFIKSFKAFDKTGNELPTEKISTNQWKINDADKLAKLVYDAEDTFDSDIEDDKVMPMAGTSISNDFILLNTFGVLGYFKGMQTNPVKVKVDYKSDWTIGTSLTVDQNGYYVAETYDHLADTPVLIGDLTTASTTVNDIKVGVYVYSSDTTINADKIMKAADKILQSSASFIGYSPVTHYNFLMCFLGMEEFRKNKFMGAGALEHSYSSLFVFPLMGGVSTEVEDDIAHEFLHVLTPLNLHSEIIQPFNFEVPTSSEHIWLYEGVTEWASDIMQMRGGLINIDEYLDRISQKASINDRFPQDISLSELSRGVYSEAVTMQFLNFYNKGAVTAALLDLRLLELSKGTRGLREVFLELLDKYGKYKPFPEKEFFDIFVDMTYPEIEQFISDYIKGTKPLPYKEYFSKLGYDYIAEKPSEDSRPILGLQIGMNDKQELTLISVDDEGSKSGLKKDDVLYKVLGEEVTMQSAGKLLGQISAMKVGDIVDVVVKRDDKEVAVKIPLQQRMDTHIFVEMESVTDQQKFLRGVWQKNL